ncbi:hypothetical protein Sjap_018827 [Stephania japonica]|uniref:Uncharacterized protein n=1 Tax=Stephania japonica TaxID=461633 RepID=A0AAP0NJW5_9MAGN
MEYKGLKLQEAVDCVVKNRLDKGPVGMIAVSNEGEVAYGFNSNAMFRGCATEDGFMEAEVRRMEDEEDDGRWRGWQMKKMVQLEVNRSRKKMMAVADSADGGRRMCSGWMKKMMGDSRGVAEGGSS